MPGLLIQLAMFGLFVGFGLIAELRQGVVERMRVTPMSRAAMLLGRALRDIVILVIQAIVMIVVAIPFGLTVELGAWWRCSALLALIGLVTAPFSYALALWMRKSEDALAPLLNAVVLPVLLLSGILLPMSLAPDWLQTIASFNPFSHAVTAARDLFNGQVGSSEVAIGHRPDGRSWRSVPSLSPRGHSAARPRKPHDRCESRRGGRWPHLRLFTDEREARLVASEAEGACGIAHGSGSGRVHGHDLVVRGPEGRVARVGVRLDASERGDQRERTAHRGGAVDTVVRDRGAVRGSRRPRQVDPVREAAAGCGERGGAGTPAALGLSEKFWVVVLPAVIATLLAVEDVKPDIDAVTLTVPAATLLIV